MRNVYIGPVEIAGIFQNLAAAITREGVTAKFIPRISSQNKYPLDDDLPWLVKVSAHCHQLATSKGPLCFIFFGALSEVLWFFWATWAIFRFDAFIFTFGSSLYRGNLDLPILRFLGKKIVVNLASGSESRPPYLNGAFQNKDTRTLTGALYIAFKTFLIAKRVRRLEVQADVIIGSPVSTSQFASKPFVNSIAVGMVVAPSEPKSLFSEAVKRDVPTLVHAPSNPLFKGTAEIRKLVRNLKNSGFIFDFLEVTNSSNSFVRHSVKNSKLVLDQLYSDTPFAALALEAFLDGRPAIVGGYAFEFLKDFFPVEFQGFFHTVEPEKYEDKIVEFLSSPTMVDGSVAQVQGFLKHHWNATSVAQSYIRILRGPIPQSWFTDPKDYYYPYGAGQHLGVTKCQIAGLIKHFGKKSLGVSHNKKLQAALIELARSG